MNNLNDIQFDKSKWQVDSEGLWFCQRVIRQHEIHVKRFVAEMKEKIYTLSVKLFREKRSNAANRYMWVLCQEIADVMGDIKSIDVYREHIYKTNIYKEITINKSAADTFITSWGMHGDGWLCRKIDYSDDDRFIIIHAYYGSSTYNTKQMSKLIDGLVQDAQALGIETRTPAELAMLIEDWKPERSTS